MLITGQRKPQTLRLGISPRVSGSYVKFLSSPIVASPRPYQEHSILNANTSYLFTYNRLERYQNYDESAPVNITDSTNSGETSPLNSCIENQPVFTAVIPN